MAQKWPRQNGPDKIKRTGDRRLIRTFGGIVWCIAAMRIGAAAP